MDFVPRLSHRLQAGNEQIIVTGGSGWMGRATLEMLDQTLGRAFEARVKAFGSTPRSLSLRSGREIKVERLDNLIAIPPQPSLIFHYAYLTREHATPVDYEAYIRKNIQISNIVAELVARTPSGGVFVLSSGAVYRRDASLDEDIQRNPYGVTKRRDELRFQALARPGMRVAVCRLFNLAGPYINKLNSYALSSILVDIAKGGPIVLRADNRVVRSYVHVRDVINLGTALLLGTPAPPEEPFDTAGDVVVEIGELASRCAVLLGKHDMVIQRPALQLDEEDRYVGDGRTMAILMAKAGIVASSLKDQILDTAAYLGNDTIQTK